ncbi:TVP38/TMEM64 family protein [Ammoniphilus sp. CFH 90114]|nr:TVP38/TMEM64 family protein [Ammoniphilus sp. CFH 90114]
MTKAQRNSIFAVVGISFVFVLLYFVQPGIRYFINDASAMLAAADIEAFRDYLLSFGYFAPIVSALLMIFQAVLAPLPAFVITFANGMLFGAFWGGLLSWSSAMLGAALCFFIARSLGRPAVEKLVSKSAIEMTDKFFQQYGKQSILVSRLLPFISFDVVSYAAGLTSMRFWGFWIATGIGQAPATILYSYLGQTASGSVKILFWIFIVTICLAVIISAWKKKSSLAKQISA